MTVTDNKNNRTRDYWMNLLGRKNDYKYGNGPYVAEKTKCVVLNPYRLRYFKTYKELLVGSWGRLFCTLYTKENLMYYDHIKGKDVNVVFGNSDKSNTFKIRKHSYGRFWVYFRSTKSDLKHRIRVSI